MKYTNYIFNHHNITTTFIANTIQNFKSQGDSRIQEC